MKYETEKDKAHELEIKAIVEATGKVKLGKTKTFSRVDFVMLRPNGTAIGLCECKARTHASDHYDTFIIDFDKVESSLFLCRHFQNDETLGPLGYFIFVKFTDGVFCYKHNSTHPLKIKEGGRTDRDDKRDLQPVVHIPMNYFRRIENGESKKEEEQSRPHA